MGEFESEPQYKQYSFRDLTGMRLTNISNRDLENLYYQFYTLEMNFQTLFCGIESSTTFFKCEKQEQELGNLSLHLRMKIHNYLSSLWSFIEAIRHLTGNYRSSEVKLHTDKTNFPPTDVFKPCRFLVGLRHTIQHGNFDVLTIDENYFNSENKFWCEVDIKSFKDSFTWEGSSSSVEDHLDSTVNKKPELPLHICRFHNKIRNPLSEVLKNAQNRVNTHKN